MTEMTGPTTMDRRHLTIWERAATLLSWLIAGGLFLSVGWTAAGPDDPLGPVSLLTRHNPALPAFQLAALAAVTAGIATVLAGRHLPDLGVLATAIGLGVLSIQGETSVYFLLTGAPAATGHAPRLAAESAVWFAVLMLAVVVSGIIGRWVQPSRGVVIVESGESPPPTGIAPAASDLPFIGDWVRGNVEETRTPLLDGLNHTVIATLIALVAFQVLSSGLHGRVIRHGQACFVVAASFWLAASFAFQIVPVRSTLWSLLSVGIAAVFAYFWASVRTGATNLPTGIPGSHFLRVLPIQFVFVGASAVVLTAWYAEIHQVTETPAADKAASPSPRSRR